MPDAVLGLGGNLGARRAIFDAAIAVLGALPDCRVVARSALYETPPLAPPQPDYLNAAVRVRYDGDIASLHALTQQIELWLGRERGAHWGSRTLDIDLLHWSDGPVRTATLEVPHPELSARTFALAPLLEVAPELAGRWAARLEELGGPPPLAQPGWPALVDEGTSLCGSWQRDECELAAQLVVMLSRSVEGELPGRLPAAAWGSHRFSGPGELFDGDGRCWLVEVVRTALASGFRVRAAAVLERDEARTAGVLLGEPGAPPRAFVPNAIEVETRGQGERRLKIHRDVPEHGFDFNGSGTM